ncbi:MAG TPA: DUF2911 domain-containing protein [Moheibacter sp.]|nr:DUF2911 domain-containing protein [Moheibacter sp.]
MRVFTLLFAFVFFGSIFGQAQTSPNNRVSPLDSIRYVEEDMKVEIVYSRPYLKGREFGKDIVPYGKVWRTGANEATVFETNQDIVIEGKVLAAGKYSLYSIPGPEETVVIFNKDWNQWGTLYNEANDALRVTVPTVIIDEVAEQFTIQLDENGTACLNWGQAFFAFQIEKDKKENSTILN